MSNNEYPTCECGHQNWHHIAWRSACEECHKQGKKCSRFKNRLGTVARLEEQMDRRSQTLPEVKPFDPAGIGTGHRVVWATDYDKLAAENARLKAAIRWVVNDMGYRAPEMFVEASALWHARLSAALEPPTRGGRRGEA